MTQGRRSRNDGTCPMCGSPSAPETNPFCSPRCRMRDLAHWIGGDEPYVIPGPAMAPGGEGFDADDRALWEEALAEAGETVPDNVIHADFRRRRRLEPGEEED